ncbi:MAG: cation:proton antiporter [Phycisphaerae bacterium]|nr:cation:proton antiporter [Phycisphaerae bacterium]
MAFGIAELILLGLMVDWLVRKIKLPGLVGLLLLGVALGPYALNKLPTDLQTAGSDLRLIALVVILLRAGFEISREALAKVGVRAVLMAFIPCFCEVAVITIIAPMVLKLTRLEAAMLGAILAAVSPAVVVPLMIKFIEEKRGAKRAVPTLVLAGASCDDAVAIVLFSSFLGMYTGSNVNIVKQIGTVPVSVITGIALGLVLGVVLYKLFDRFNPRATKRVLILLGLAIVLHHFEKTIIIPFASLLAIMAVGFIILEKREHAAHEISSKLSKIWVFASILLFTLVGAQVNIPVARNAGLAGAAVILLGLVGRSIGTQLCLLKSNFTTKEKVFVGISYLPKATVQAAIGAVPLVEMQRKGLDTAPGDLILAVAVLSILITAPLGALAISWAGKNLLQIDGSDDDPAMLAAIESE